MAIQRLELLIVFSVSLNLFAGMLVGTGVAQDIGLGGQLQVGGDKATQKAQNQVDELSTGAPTGQTLFGMYNVLSSTLGAMRHAVFAAPAMLYNAGVPGEFTSILEAVMGIAYGLGLIKFLRGI